MTSSDKVIAIEKQLKIIFLKLSRIEKSIENIEKNQAELIKIIDKVIDRVRILETHAKQ